MSTHAPPVTLDEVMKEARRAREAETTAPTAKSGEARVDPRIPEDHDTVPTGSIPAPKFLRRLFGDQS